MRPAKPGTWVDSAGVFLSLACMVHCMVLPLALLALQFFGLYQLKTGGNEGEWFHAFMAFFVVTAGLFAFGRGYKNHSNSRIVLIGALGTLLVVFAAINPKAVLSETAESVVTVLGTIALMTAHLKNKTAMRAPHIHSHCTS